MKFFIIIISCLIFAGMAFAGDDIKTINTEINFACQDRQEFKTIKEYQDKHNTVMINRTLGEGLKSGECISLSTGDNLYVVEKQNGLIKVRKEGVSGEYWTDFRE